jgi:hypothetical protein
MLRGCSSVLKFGAVKHEQMSCWMLQELGVLTVLIFTKHDVSAPTIRKHQDYPCRHAMQVVYEVVTVPVKVPLLIATAMQMASQVARSPSAKLNAIFFDFALSSTHRIQQGFPVKALK